ncbi:ORF6C domain-containing protein [Clostridium butyricum]|uniref:Rha family transcriptional regulator n=1 Tax=Clostridium butyricum TaxID=1492 RepID=UPI003466D839
MRNVVITNYQGIDVIDSLKVSEITGKAHDKLLRDIRGYIDIISRSPKLESENFFVESEYFNSRNQKQPCYLLTKQGCEMVANKMTGEKGILFTAEYVEAFNKANQHIPKMSKELEAILMIDGKQQKMDERITKLENNTTIDYSQQEDLRELANKKIIAILGGTDAPAYRELNKKVFSNFWRDYKRKLNVNSYKNTLVKDYELGRQFIISWQPSKEVKFMIDGCNAQIRM